MGSLPLENNMQQLKVEDVEVCEGCQRVFDRDALGQCTICERLYCKDDSCDCGIKCDVCGVDYCEDHDGLKKEDED